MHADPALPQPFDLPPAVASRSALAGLPADHIAFAGQVLAFTYDEQGRCDGFVLELHGQDERYFESSGPKIEATLRRTVAARQSTTVLVASAAPRRLIAILPNET